MKVAIVKYNSGNIRSVQNALARLGVEASLTDDPKELAAADRVIFPGVGEASSAMAYLRTKGLDGTIRSLTQPVLGICLGMQLLGRTSAENNTDCLGILPYAVHRFDSSDVKVPHVGWNNISGLRSSLFDGIAESEYMYFVHSYFVETGPETIAETEPAPSQSSTRTGTMASRSVPRPTRGSRMSAGGSDGSASTSCRSCGTSSAAT